jgi:hypothetical protein
VPLCDRFPKANFQQLFYWFLEASRYGRYSGSTTTALEEDLKTVAEAQCEEEALVNLLWRIEKLAPLTKAFFFRDYSDARFGRLILYLMVWRNGAQDWDSDGHRLGFEGAELLADYKPQWHHIFPKALLAEKGYTDDQINAIANIAVIGPNMNIRISKQNPLDYIDRYNITSTKLAQQYIHTDPEKLKIENYPEWVDRRAETLAAHANEYFDALTGELRKRVMPNPAHEDLDSDVA